MPKEGYSYEIVFLGDDPDTGVDDVQLPAQVLSEVRYRTGDPEIPPAISSGAQGGTVTMPLGEYWTLPTGSLETTESIIAETPCHPSYPVTELSDLSENRSLLLELWRIGDDHQTFRLSIKWDADSPTGQALGPIEREWFIETPRRGANFIAMTFEFSHSEASKASSFEALKFFWSSEVIDSGGEEGALREEVREETFRLPLYEDPGDEFNEVATEGAIGLPFSEFRAWATPLRDAEVRAHQMDWLSWGVTFPVDEGLFPGEAPGDGVNDPSEDPFDPDNFPARAWLQSAKSRRQRLMISSWDSFTLRGQEDAPQNAFTEDGSTPENRVWQNTVTPEEWALGPSDVVLAQTFRLSSIDQHWDDSVKFNPIRSFGNEIRNDINPTEQPVADWRFSIEFSPTSAISRDFLRGLSDAQRLDDWVGAPEWQAAGDYPALRDWANGYFGSRSQKIRSNSSLSSEERIDCDRGRLWGPITYLEAMRLHRWLWMNLRGLIEELIPFNVSYLGFHNVIEPLPHERAKIRYPGSNRYLDPLERLDVSELRLIILDALIQRF